MVYLLEKATSRREPSETVRAERSGGQIGGKCKQDILSEEISAWKFEATGC